MNNHLLRVVLSRVVASAFSALVCVCAQAAPASPVSEKPTEPASRLVRELSAGRKQHLVVYGTSLTHGGAWVAQTQEALERAYPGLVRITNSGSPGKNSRWGVENLDAKVLAEKPDAVLIEFSINDAVTRFDLSLEESARNLDIILDRLAKELPGCEPILQIMNPVVGRPEGHRSHRREQEKYWDIYRDAARKRGLLLVDHTVAWKKILAEGEPAYRRLVPDGTHPNAEGNARVVTPGLLRTLGVAAAPTLKP